MNAKPLWRRWSLALPAFALAAAVAVQCLPAFRSKIKTRDPRIAQSVPAALPGWIGRDVPLGSNEFLTTEAASVLNFDEYVNREFSRNGENLGVYVAYWGDGKMPTQLVASHTPDRCWTETGWRCLAMKFKQDNTIDGVTLQPAEWRLFEPPDGGKPTYVLYWHLVEGRAYDYGNRFNAIPDPFLWWKGAVKQMLLGSREQYFIRITSSEPFENLRGDPGFADVMRSLERLGIAANRGEGISRR
jgi:hypothetical protein